jgi:hypothetical protein
MSYHIATCMVYTAIDPFTKQQVYVARGLRNRNTQRALTQFFKPENWFIVREALIQAGRQDLIGNGCDCLIAAQPTKEALDARRREANRTGRRNDDHYHTVADPAKGEKPGERGLNKGYRPGSKSVKRRKRNGGNSAPRPWPAAVRATVGRYHSMPLAGLYATCHQVKHYDAGYCRSPLAHQTSLSGLLGPHHGRRLPGAVQNRSWLPVRPVHPQQAKRILPGRAARWPPCPPGEWCWK